MPLSSIAQSPGPEIGDPPIDSGAVLRLMRLVLAAVDASGVDGCRLSRDSALVSVARGLVGEATDSTGVSRTAMMALRDLVWRVDTARGLLVDRTDEHGRAEVELLLDTADIHVFLDTTVPKRRPDPEEAEEIA